jgi:hypothetical protein
MPVNIYNATKGLTIQSITDRGDASFDPIPTGQVLIIRQLSAEFLMDPGQGLVFLNLITVANQPGHWFAPRPAAQIGLQKAVVFSAHTHLYVDSEVVMKAFLLAEGVSGEVTGRVTISGELVPR